MYLPDIASILGILKSETIVELTEALLAVITTCSARDLSTIHIFVHTYYDFSHSVERTQELGKCYQLLLYVLVTIDMVIWQGSGT